MNDNAKKGIDEFVKRIKSKYKNKVKKIILYGSYARGDYREESDVDFLIVGDLNLDDVVDIITDILLKYGILISVVIEKEKDFKEHIDYSFHKEVLKEGIELYSAWFF